MKRLQCWKKRFTVWFFFQATRARCWSLYRNYPLHLACVHTLPCNVTRGRSQWCGLRLSVLGQDRSDSKKSVLVLHAAVLVLVLQVWCSVVKQGLVTLVIIMILKDAATFQVLFIVSLFCAWNITTADQKLNPPSDFVYFRWSWSCSCYFGLGLGLVSSGLGLVTLVLVLVFRMWSCLH